MSSPINNCSSSLNVTPNGLFPDHEEASKDEKCEIVSKLVQEVINSCDMTKVCQEDLVNYAKKRYEYISIPEKLQFWQADDAAFQLYQKGVSPETAKKYISFRMSQKDKDNWKIVLV